MFPYSSAFDAVSSFLIVPLFPPYSKQGLGISIGMSKWLERPGKRLLRSAVPDVEKGKRAIS
jgi:hypothetical protein